MKSPVIKRSIVIAGHKTSVSIEDAFWSALKDIAQARRQSLAELIGVIDGVRRGGNLSSTIRVFVLDYYRGRQVIFSPPPGGGRSRAKASGRG